MMQFSLKTAKFRAFYADYVAGRCHQPFLAVVQELLSLLENQACQIPSVIINDSGDEPDKLFSPYTLKLLSSVSLATHALYTAEEGISLLSQRERDGLFYPIILISTLASDLGLLPAGRRIYEHYGHHPQVSSILVRDFLEDLSSKAVEVILAAIQYHHQTLENPHTVVEWTRLAQERARIRELYEIPIDTLQLASEWEKFKVKPLKRPIISALDDFEFPKKQVLTGTEIKVPWFTVQEFLGTLQPVINTTSSRDAAFSLRNGKIYCYLSILFKIFRKLALGHNWREILIYEGNNEAYQQVLAFIVNKLTQAGVVEAGLGKGRYFALYTIELQCGRVIGPVAMVPFYAYRLTEDLAELEQRKLGWFTDIKAVRRYTKKNGVGGER